MAPQLAIGGWAPIPKKLNPLSMSMADAKLAAEITITGAMILGRMCLVIILKSLNPNALAAVTYCISLTLIICPRTTLATSTHMVSPTAINTCQNPLPKANVIAITSNNVGIDHVTFIIHIITASILPPKYPAKLPINNPITKEMKTATNPTKKYILAPTNTRLNKSLPYLSVPKTKVFSFIKPSMELFGNICKGTVFSGPNRPSDAYSVYNNVSLETT